MCHCDRSDSDERREEEIRSRDPREPHYEPWPAHITDVRSDFGLDCTALLKLGQMLPPVCGSNRKRDEAYRRDEVNDVEAEYHLTRTRSATAFRSEADLKREYLSHHKM